MMFMKHYVSPDVVPDHPLVLFFGVSGIALGDLLKVSPGLVWGATVILLFNVITTFVFTYWRDNEINGELIQSTVLRVGGYIVCLAGVLIWSNMGSGEAGGAIREIAFRGIAGIELGVMVGMFARMVKRFRPIYRAIITTLDRTLPFDFGSKQVSAILDYYDGEDEKKENA